MARDFNPNDLSARYVLRIVAQTIIGIAALLTAVFLVSRFAPDFVGLFIALIGIGVYVVVTRLPKKDLAAIVEKEREAEENIGKIPIVGPVVKFGWRLFNWLIVGLGMIMLILLVSTTVMNLS